MSSVPQPPPDELLIPALKELRIANPTLGIPKMLSQLKTAHPEWTISEKRLRKVAGAQGLALAAPVSSDPAKTTERIHPDVVPRSHIDETLDVQCLARKVQIKMFKGGKGKGVVAKEKIEEGEVIWFEEPWVCCPDVGILPMIHSHHICGYCLHPFPEVKPALVTACLTCPHALFCSRLCLARATSSQHLLLCPGVNPAAKDAVQFACSEQWRAFDSVLRVVARWRIARELEGPEGAEREEKRTKSFAMVSQRSRAKEMRDWEFTAESHERLWRKGHQMLLSALNPDEDTDPINYNRFYRLINSISRPKHGGGSGSQPTAQRMQLKKGSPPLTEAEIASWFSYERFLELLGMVNLNSEDAGGLYALHAHLNHSCEPNVTARHLPKSYVPPTELPATLPPPGDHANPPYARLHLLARRTIQPGEELCITYVNPSSTRDVRRKALREGYVFWCQCGRCQRDAAGGEASEDVD